MKKKLVLMLLSVFLVFTLTATPVLAKDPEDGKSSGVPFQELWDAVTELQQWVANFSVSWNDITGIPSDIADGDDDTQLTDAEITAMGYIKSYTGVDWADISGIPADIADGDQDTQLTDADIDAMGYIKSGAETDPVFGASDASGITSGDIANWDTAYSWGDHSTVGYLTSLPPNVMEEGENVSLLNNDAGYITSETDPTVLTSVKDGVDWLELSGIPAGFADGVDNEGGAGDGHSLDAADGTPVDAVYVDDDGEVGIGTASPNHRLDVAGDINSSGGFRLDGDIVLSNTGTNNILVGKDAGASNTGSSNSAVGYEALRNNTTGSYNSAMGYRALYYNTTGSNNSAMGFGALVNNTTGNFNSAMGYQALRSNTTGISNSAMGNYTLFSNTTGNYNTAVGLEAGRSNSTGNNNVFLGYRAGFNETGSNKLYIDNSSTATPLIYGDFTADIVGINGSVGIGTPSPSYRLDVAGDINSTESFKLDGDIVLSNTGAYNILVGENAGASINTGSNNSAVGYSALYSNTGGTANSAMGSYALYANTTGWYNSAMGFRALQNNTTGISNSSMGYEALYYNTTGSANSAVGGYALRFNTGSFNSAMGGHALYYNTTGGSNSAMGYDALYSNTTGGFNSAMGNYAGRMNQTGNKNVFLGYEAGYNETGSNKLYIANSSSDPPLIYGDFTTGKVSIKNLHLIPQSTAPSSPSEGDIYYDANDNKLKCYDGDTWQSMW